VTPSRRLKILRDHADRLLSAAERLLASCDDPKIAELPAVRSLKSEVTAATKDLVRAFSEGNADAVETSILNLDGAIHALAVVLRGTLESLLPKPTPSS
jgi:hypothetical protein